MLARLQAERPQIREIAVWFNLVCAAIGRVDQCVASVAALSGVAVITRSTSWSLIVRGRPGRATGTGMTQPIR